jgi:hypothetical protein
MEPLDPTNIEHPGVCFNISALGIADHGCLTGKLIVCLESKYGLYVHIVIELDTYYQFLIKNLGVDGGQLVREIKR